MRASRKKRRKIMREWLSTITKAISGRRARPTARWPKCAPVDLRLLARQRAQAQVGLGWRARAQLGDEVAEVRVAPT
jgi:hypothetical protein